jgi:hypothetical protein
MPPNVRSFHTQKRGVEALGSASVVTKNANLRD